MICACECELVVIILVLLGLGHVFGTQPQTAIESIWSAMCVWCVSVLA
jgi:hypothetical protein